MPTLDTLAELDPSMASQIEPEPILVESEMTAPNFESEATSLDAKVTYNSS